MEKMFLTNGGNLLRFHPTKKFYFQKPDGEFIREVSDSEAQYLCQNCLEIEVYNTHEHPEFFPTWYFVKSIQVIQDNSNYRWETCNDGGNYSFKTYHDWYVAKYPNGEWKFAFVERHSTSADFEYDDLVGRFQSDLGELHISNGMGCPTYSSQRGIEWKDGEKFYTSSEVLEKIATMSSFEDMWNEEYEFIPSRWDEGEEGAEIRKALSFSDKKDIITRLKELYDEVLAEELQKDEVLKFCELHLHFKRSKSSRRGRRGGRR